ncbi:MAG TPA: ester cyclase [Pirellulales bacterium]|jgi:steroid delta-isomerase-like uncharacterized protein|nr:ester cyclase [Pirellulales bacterium]
MTSDNIARARDWFEQIWNQRRIDLIESFAAPNSIAHLESGDVSAVAAFRAIHREFLSAFPDLAMQVEATIADAENVVVRWTASGSHQGAGFGIEPTGRAARFRGMTWMRFERGMIAEGWDAWNQGGLLQQLRAEGAKAEG